MASKGINKVILVGNLGQDPEIRVFKNGDSVANITVATSETWKDKIPESNERKQSGTEFLCLKNSLKFQANTLKKEAKYT